MTRHLLSGRRMEGKTLAPVASCQSPTPVSSKGQRDSRQNQPCTCPGLGKARQAPLSLSLPPFLVLAGMRRGLGALHGRPGLWAALRWVALHTDSSHPPSDSWSPVREGRKTNDARNCHLHWPPRAMRESPAPASTVPSVEAHTCRFADIWPGAARLRSSLNGDPRMRGVLAFRGLSGEISRRGGEDL